MLLSYLIRTISIAIGQPKRFSSRLIVVMPAVLVPVLSMTILRGMPFTSSAWAKNFVASALLRRFESIKSRLLGLVDGPVEICPFALHLDVGFIHALSSIHCGFPAHCPVRD